MATFAEARIRNGGARNWLRLAAGNLAAAALALCLHACGSVDPSAPPQTDPSAAVDPAGPPPQPGTSIAPPETNTQEGLSFTVAPVYCCDPRSMVFAAQVPDGTDPAGIVFQWDFGDGRTGQGATVEHTYSWAGDYNVTLKADLGDGAVRSADRTVNLSDSPADPTDPSSAPPEIEDSSGSVAAVVIARAGPDRTAVAGSVVTLDGSASRGTGTPALLFTWRQLDGPAVSILNPSHYRAFFVAPANLRASTTLVFQLTVSQGGAVATDQVQVAVPCGQCDETDLPAIGDSPNEAAIAQVLSGQLTTANASWWGFDAADSTDALQSAIQSGAKTVIVPNVGKPWFVRPLFLVSNQEIVFNAGVVVAAKQGAFRGTSDCLLTGDGVSNVTLRGYGAVLQMRKADYTGEGYALSEFRHLLVLRGAQNVQVLGLSLESSGGDGIYLGPRLDSRYAPCRQIQIKDCTVDDHYRQGISVVSAENLRIVNCIVRNTIGTLPAAGIDFEPSDPDDRLIDLEVRDCLLENNPGGGIAVGLSYLDQRSAPVSIRVVDCVIRGPRSVGILALQKNDKLATGTVEFQGCTCEDINQTGLYCVWNLDSPLRLRFLNCEWHNVARWPYEDPIYLELTGKATDLTKGGIEFQDCYVYDSQRRLTVDVVIHSASPSALDVAGEIYVVNESIEEPVPQKDWLLPDLSVVMHTPN